MVVAPTLLNRKLCADTVSSTENHISCIWVTGPVPGLLLEEGGRSGVIRRLVRFFFINGKYHSSLSTTLTSGAVTMDWPPSLYLFVHLFVCPFINKSDTADRILTDLGGMMPLTTLIGLEVGVQHCLFIQGIMSKMSNSDDPQLSSKLDHHC